MRNLHLIILQEYGIEARHLFREWERLRLREIDYKIHRIFTLRCLDRELNTTRAKQIIRKAEKDLIQARIKSINNILTNVAIQTRTMQVPASTYHFNRETLRMPGLC